MVTYVTFRDWATADRSSFDRYVGCGSLNKLPPDLFTKPTQQKAVLAESRDPQSWGHPSLQSVSCFASRFPRDCRQDLAPARLRSGVIGLEQLRDQRTRRSCPGGLSSYRTRSSEEPYGVRLFSAYSPYHSLRPSPSRTLRAASTNRSTTRGSS